MGHGGGVAAAHDERRPDDRDPSTAAVEAARAERDRHGDELLAVALGVLPDWVQRSVADRLADAGSPSPDEVSGLVADAAAAAVEDARTALAESVRRLPGIDVGPPPLQVFRTLVRHPTEVLRQCDVAPVVRGEFEQRAFPDDVYDLSPATWADIDPALHEPGLTWSAATAYLHKVIRREL